MPVRIADQFFGKRFAVASFFYLFCLALLAVRLYYLQGIQGAYFRDRSENNRTRTVRTIAARGTILDREDRILVGNRPSFDVELILEDTPNLEQTLGSLSQISGRSQDDLRKQLQSQRTKHHFEPKTVISDASREELAKVKVNSYRLPGVIVDVLPTRFYPFDGLAAQTFGYAREITRTQLEKVRDRNYRQGDLIGQSGLESTWEQILRGQNGRRQVEVDARGNRRSELGLVPALTGKDIYLTLDVDLQQIAEKELEGRRGAIVAIDPADGAVLVLASAPTFNLNLFARQIADKDWVSITTDKDKPLTNRAISEVYPAGSTFKLVTSFAGLAEKKITTSTHFDCPGYYFFARRRYHCHKKTGHGSLNLERALTVSCNSYYFQLGQLLGIGLIEKYAKMLGLGAPTGIDLPGETAGIVPSEKWKLEKHDVKWYPGDTLPVSIGQGYLVVSPIQLALMASVLSNNGYKFRPHLVRRVVDTTTGEVIEFGPGKKRLNPHTLEIEDEPYPQRIATPIETFEAVRKIAAEVVNNPSGTGKAAKFEEIVVAGKTGTAQVSALGRERLHERLNDHAWFVSFAPADKPMIAMAIIVENGGHGGSTSAPIARKILEKFFRKKGMLKEEAITPPVAADTDVEEGVPMPPSEDSEGEPSVTPN